MWSLSIWNVFRVPEEPSATFPLINLNASGQLSPAVTRIGQCRWSMENSCRYRRKTVDNLARKMNTQIPEEAQMINKFAKKKNAPCPYWQSKHEIKHNSGPSLFISRVEGWAMVTPFHHSDMISDTFEGPVLWHAGKAAAHCRMLIWVSAAPLSIQLLANVPGKAAIVGPSVWSLAFT